MKNQVEHYMVLVEGLFAMRAVMALSAKTEAEIAAVHEVLWGRMSPEEQERLDGEHGLIEQAKKRWGMGVPALETFPVDDELCPVCGEPRYLTYHGPVCKNGHGG